MGIPHQGYEAVNKQSLGAQKGQGSKSLSFYRKQTGAFGGGMPKRKMPERSGKEAKKKKGLT